MFREQDWDALGVTFKRPEEIASPRMDGDGDSGGQPKPPVPPPPPPPQNDEPGGRRQQ